MFLFFICKYYIIYFKKTTANIKVNTFKIFYSTRRQPLSLKYPELNGYTASSSHILSLKKACFFNSAEEYIAE